MVDMFSSEQGKQLFGLIGAAATLGGIFGATITASAVKSVGVPFLLICAAILIELGLFAARRLGSLVRPPETSSLADLPMPASDAPIGGSAIAGFTHALHDPYLLQIGVYMLLYAILGFVAKFKRAPKKGVRVIGTITAYAARPNSSAMKCASPTASPLASHFTRPFRIMATVSMPCNVRQAL
jgi:hypothetical protein